MAYRGSPKRVVGLLLYVVLLPPMVLHGFVGPLPAGRASSQPVPIGPAAEEMGEALPIPDSAFGMRRLPGASAPPGGESRGGARLLPTVPAVLEPRDPQAADGTPSSGVAGPLVAPPTLGVETASAAAIPFTFGQTVTGTIPVPENVVTYTFAANNGDVILIWASEQDSFVNPQISLYAPDGARVHTAVGSQGELEVTQPVTSTGIYTMTVEDADFVGGDFSLFVQRVNDPGSATPIALGSVVTRELTLATEMGTYTFTATAGDVVFSRMAVVSGTLYPLLRLYGPDGSLLAEGRENMLSELFQSLPTTGTYTLLAGDWARLYEGRVYGLYLQRTNGPTGADRLTYGETVTRTIGSFLETDPYTFTAQAGDVIRVSTFSISGSLVPKTWLVGPEGFVMYQGTADQKPVVSMTLPVAGDYAIFVGDRDGDGTGTYQLQLEQVGAVSATLVLRPSGPQNVSPGQTVDYAVAYQNPLTGTLQDVVIVAQLPEYAVYLSSTGGGLYWLERNQVVWKLGDVGPGQSGVLSVRVQYLWGLRNGMLQSFRVTAAARNYPNPRIDLDEYLAFQPAVVITGREMTEAEVDDLLNNNPEVLQFVQLGQSKGFRFDKAGYKLTVDVGGQVTETTQLALLKPDEHEIWIINVYAGSVFVETYAGSQFGILTSDGSIAMDLEAGSETGSGSSSSCLLGCIGGQIPWWILGKLFPIVDVAFMAADCFRCGQGDARGCLGCGVGVLARKVPLLGIALDIADCLDKCQKPQPCKPIASCGPAPDSGAASQSLEMWPSVVTTGGSGSWVEERECDPVTGALGPPSYSECPEGESCVNGACGPTDELPSEVTGAHDPNAKYGPACALPGQVITYTVEYENEGAGTAYGVYVTDKLPAVLDESTLNLQDDGVYVASTRTIIWQVGEVASRAGGTLHFSVQVPSTVVSGTKIVNSATVYFPSVPEETPTNPVVTLVGTVVAYPQEVETVEGVSKVITLTGATVGVGTLSYLTYTLVTTPSYGTLVGTPPVITYTPMANFEGMDRFTFRVSNGVTESAPAEVSILVRPGSETTPPTVQSTSPASGTKDVPVFTVQTAPGIYRPYIWVRFSEPISATTLTNDTFFLTDAKGNRVSGQVTYNGLNYSARFLPAQPLRWGTRYTATLTTGIRDTSGNPLSSNYVWSFSTQELHLYLPVVLKGG